jgi:hypothetical protein
MQCIKFSKTLVHRIGKRCGDRDLFRALALKGFLKGVAAESWHSILVFRVLRPSYTFQGSDRVVRTNRRRSQKQTRVLLKMKIFT